MNEPFEIFFSYAHEDEDLMNDVRRQLVVYERNGRILKWHDRMIPAGADWRSRIDNRLMRAKVVLLFMSPHFIDSRYCYEVEGERALERHRQLRTRVVPIILRPCAWDQTPFADIQALPRDGKAISLWENRDEACLDAARGVMRLVDELSGKRLGAPSSEGELRAEQPSIRAPTSDVASPFSDGRGGRGGGGNAVGEGSAVIAGRGGPGGSPGGGRGGDGGGGDAVGRSSIVIGGDGGGGGRADGRGGMGAASPLKRLSPEMLKSWGLTGNEGYGQGGRGANSPEYDRSLRVLGVLSAEYASLHPETRMIPMPGVLMPPVEWVNGRLIQMQETFRVELIDNGTDFFLQRISKT